MRDAAARSFKLGEGAQAPWKWERKAMAGEMKKQRASWSGKWAFILAAAASAVGLGNMWRFPYLAAKYGGGTFLLTYVVLVFTFGVSLLLLETALGRKTGQSAIGAFKAFGKKYAFIGILASAVPFIITPYYCIIGGWVTKYTAAYLVNGPEALADGGDFFTGFITSNAESYIWMLVFMAIVFVIVGLGVKGGIEKANLFMMPALIIMAVAIAIYTLTMPGAVEGALYYLTPDFSKFSPELVIGALGQMFYSLSLAMGIMITYGSYVKDDVDLSKANNQIEIFDTGVAFLAGLMIIPAVYVFLGTDGMASGPSLTFISLPKVFAAMGGVGRIIGAVFFLALGFAALTSCVSVMETLVANCMEIFHKSRKEMCAAVGVYSLVTAVLICLGYNALYFELPLPNGSTAQLLDVMDYISNSFLMPFISLLTSILIGWIVGPKWIIAEVEKNGEHFGRAKLYSVMMKYIVPVVMLILFLTSTGLGSLIFGS